MVKDRDKDELRVMNQNAQAKRGKRDVRILSRLRHDSLGMTDAARAGSERGWAVRQGGGRSLEKTGWWVDSAGIANAKKPVKLGIERLHRIHKEPLCFSPG